jgi:hypothetical protein
MLGCASISAVPAAAYNLVDGLTDGVVAVGAAGP